MNIRGFGRSSIKVINLFEETIGFTLPEDYIQFLLTYNGGSDRMDEFFVPELKDSIPTDIFFGLDIDKELDLHTWFEEYKNDLLPNTIIIAHDPGTGIIVLINDPKIHGIYYWDHTFSFRISSKESNIFKIADSFQEFIVSLTPIDNT